MRTPLCSRAISRSHREELLGRMGTNKWPKKTAGPWSQERRRQHAKACRYGKNNALHLNKKGICEEQLKRRLLIVADIVGRGDFTNDELKTHDAEAYSAVRKRYKGGLNGFREKVGWDTARKHLSITEDELVAAMRAKQAEVRRLPVERDFQNGRPKFGEFIRAFGSWNRARTIAFGLDERQSK